ncbi:GDH/6PGL endoplasmic bifunctional protein [Megalops cyprinoides]|uniref:GDH/6PGL endoplasmic bifunctional protein n=1 Tax=Megalops cyprinoides TaxID=118141 RepID=UPI001863A057|nr:GDH/6PGL endoplasmic bifunctional protein [Megalops cyprinoides]XP_036388224.1 GDH/6PGL endoplasmic bifunctional protein [Megalops cyprinoides]
MWNIVCALALLGGAWAKEGQGGEAKGHVTVVVVGATGDLARKYLWQGFFQLYADQVGGGHSFSFYGGALSETDNGTPVLFEILKGLACPPGLTPERCALLRDQFLKLAQYRRLKTAEDYASLSAEVAKAVQQEGLTEAGRLFYLSVPAFAYAGVAENINGSCRPPSGAWLRVVLEKPFGHDLGSAQVLSAQLEKSLKEEEMYRIDHYLGKQVVSQILPFRKENRMSLEPIWNKHHIERIEIVLKETLDAKGRIQFYDQYGVIRDVLQNHLTEVMTLLTMEVPANLRNSQDVMRKKLEVFGALQQLVKSSAVVGQYQAYNAEVQEELNKTKEHVSITPTFAGVVVHLDNSQFDGVPIFLISGKMLDERVGYARVLFKNEVVCVQNPSSVHCKPRQIIFHFGHGDLHLPAVLVSKNLFKPATVEGWKEPEERKDLSLFGLALSDYHVQTPAEQKEAYGLLISQIFRGRRDNFVSAEVLLASWSFWTPLLYALAHEFPRPYPGGAANGNLLDLELHGREVAFLGDGGVVVIPQDGAGGSGGAASAGSFQVTQGKFRGADMVSAWAEELVYRLAADLQEAAEEAVREGGRFHLALSGGSSPLALFHRLALHHYAFPWRHTHVWMVDERCVPLSEPGSNFRALHDHLLHHVRLPYFNAHPMPVQLNQRLCVEEDGGPLAYERDIARQVNGSSFHFVLLGVGYDGHTASLFPGARPEVHGDRLVALTESPAKPHQRMSLTLAAINRARKVGVLVTGKGKHELITQLSRVKDDPQKWPITGVKPNGGKLVWYIDYEALLG